MKILRLLPSTHPNIEQARNYFDAICLLSNITDSIVNVTFDSIDNYPLDQFDTLWLCQGSADDKSLINSFQGNVVNRYAWRTGTLRKDVLSLLWLTEGVRTPRTQLKFDRLYFNRPFVIKGYFNHFKNADAILVPGYPFKWLSGKSEYAVQEFMDTSVLGKYKTTTYGFIGTDLYPLYSQTMRYWNVGRGSQTYRPHIAPFTEKPEIDDFCVVREAITASHWDLGVINFSMGPEGHVFWDINGVWEIEPGNLRCQANFLHAVFEYLGLQISGDLDEHIKRACYWVDYQVFPQWNIWDDEGKTVVTWS